MMALTNNVRHFFAMVVLFFLAVTPSIGQVFLQLEVDREVMPLRFTPGDIFVYKSTETGDDWQTRRIERLIVEDQIIVFADSWLNIQDITRVRVRNQPGWVLGKILTTFGSAWFVFGGIAHLATDYTFTWRDFTIGAVGVGLGWLITKFASRRTYKLGKKHRLRVVDISFPTPTEIHRRT
jgi:hypothetical protein